MRKIGKLIKRTAVLTGLMLVASGAALAERFEVINTDDFGRGSLRQAILDANESPEDDLIVFSPLFKTPQTIRLQDTLPAIQNNGAMKIKGPGAGLLTVSGENNSRILLLFENAKLEVTDLTLANGAATDFFGNQGGAVVNSGMLRLKDVVLENNRAGYGGAIYNEFDAVAELVKTTVRGNSATEGGAIYNNYGKLSLEASLLTANEAVGTGGIYSEGLTLAGGGSVLISETTVSNNRGNNGGVVNFRGNLTITRSTFSGNVGANVGAILNDGWMTLVNSTVSGNSSTNGQAGGLLLRDYNGDQESLIINSTIVKNLAPVFPSYANAGGVLVDSPYNSVKARNTIIALNTDGDPAQASDVTGAVNSQGNNLVGNPGSSTGWITAGANADLLNQNPLIGALASNGGKTRTHALLAGSPALNAGSNCVLTVGGCGANDPVEAITTDQRGVARPQNATVDIGSFEKVLNP